MANDSSLLPGTPTPPPAATLTTSSAGTGATANNAIAYDYSPHIIRILTAIEQISYSLAFIADKIDNMSDKSSEIATNSSAIRSSLATMASSSTTIATAATGDGIHMKGAQDWIGLISTYKLYVEDSGAIGLTALEGYKAKIDSLPRAF
jgi:DNA-binding NarL/FixJ family response regulator